MPSQATKRTLPKTYFTDGNRLLRLQCNLSGGRGVIIEDCRKNILISMTVQEFMKLKPVL